MQVRLSFYSNPSSVACNGVPCNNVRHRDCDNEFTFCVVGGSDVCLTNVTTPGIISDDSFTFGSAELNELSISNPILIGNISDSVSTCIHVCTGLYSTFFISGL